MIDKNDISLLMQAVSVVMREYVTTFAAGITGRIDEVDARLKQIPADPKGDPGAEGPQGLPGEVGASGPQGPAGRDGVDGKDGMPGLNGKDGASGIDGKDGAAGRDGKDGIDGIHGKDGAAGLNGKDGKDGVAGRDAESIHPDTIRVLILDEVDKAIAKIPKAKDGRDGEPGRDAVQIDILSQIPEKSVPRGTFAQHRGGLWRATKTTDKFEDWICICDGIDETVMTQGDDPRDVSIAQRLASGKETVLKLHIPMPLHKGIYSDGTEYHGGDIVQFGGSMWLVRAVSTKSRPDEKHADWVLVVRRGRDGKDKQ